MLKLSHGCSLITFQRGGGVALKAGQFCSRNRSFHSPQPLQLLSPCVNRKSLLLPTRLLLLHGQFLSVLCTQCYLAGCAVNVNLSLNPLLKGERLNKRCQVMLSDSLTDACGVGLLIQTSCVDLKLHQISKSGPFVFQNCFLFIL